MELPTITNWTQVITGVAVLIGLGLVIWELQQTREIATAQQITNSFSAYSSQLQAMMGEESVKALAKACDHPDSLTTEDMIVLGYFYTDVINELRSALHQASNTDLAVFEWKQWTGNFDTIFATEYGRWWWGNQKWEPEIMEAGNAWLAEKPTRNCADEYASYRNRHQQ